jgi:hypothetical protein
MTLPHPPSIRDDSIDNGKRQRTSGKTHGLVIHQLKVTGTLTTPAASADPPSSIRE